LESSSQNGKISWLVVSTPLKNISQIGSSSQLLGKIKNVPNHQPVSKFAAKKKKLKKPRCSILMARKWVSLPSSTGNRPESQTFHHRGWCCMIVKSTSAEVLGSQFL